MHLMYVDESGDPGLNNSPTPIFVLAGLVMHELRWREIIDEILAFRQRMRDSFGLRVREEIHAAPFINHPGSLVRIKKNDRLTILRHYADTLASIPDLSLISVIVDKSNKAPDYDVHQHAWQALIQRFENTLSHRNFPGPVNQDDRGIVYADGDVSGHLVKMMRRMRHYNPVPSKFGGYRNLPMTKIIEDPSFRDSAGSLLIQSADVVAYSLYQQENPNAYMRKSGGKNYYSRMAPIQCRHASPNDPQGIVRL
jgi:Protein of unknown function (DUF3800)